MFMNKLFLKYMFCLTSKLLKLSKKANINGFAKILLDNAL